jgi:hypothetical protein
MKDGVRGVGPFEKCKPLHCLQKGHKLQAQDMSQAWLIKVCVLLKYSGLTFVPSLAVVGW